MSEAVPAGWEGILDPGERILWQGRPDGRIVIRGVEWILVAFGAVFAGIALAYMIGMAEAGGPWPFGLIHFAAGVAVAAGPPLWSAYRRRRTWYTLTDRRAFIATDTRFTGRTLRSWPIRPDTPLMLEDGNPPSLWFGSEPIRTKRGMSRAPIGFERIADAPAVMALMRGIQRQAATE
jgi:hypothetical protein